jgi:hypothetical protein
MNYFKRNGFFIVTLVLFLLSLALHFVWGWLCFIAEELEKGVNPDQKTFLLQWGRDVMENWQSELLQTAYTVVALKYLRFIGSPQSKEGNDRMERKIDWIMSQMSDGDIRKAGRLDNFCKQLDKEYPKS